MILPPSFADDLCTIARQAGDAILSIRNGQDLGIQHKFDGSPVTRADHAAQAIIVDGLRRITPEIPIIAEEMSDIERNALHDTYWLVDPLDGTRDFITGRNDFSVNIGLIVKGTPSAGVIFAPGNNDMLFGMIGNVFRISERGKQNISDSFFQDAPITPPRLTLSVRDAKKNPTDDWLSNGIISSASIRASAYKMLLVACNEADIFLRTSITYEWDTAAGDAILHALGGKVLTPDGKRLSYNKPGRENGNLIAIRRNFKPDELDRFLEICGKSSPKC